MSHDGSWRAACLTRNWILILHFETPSVARGVTGPGVGSGALLGRFERRINTLAPGNRLHFFSVRLSE
jgi:hypothetical protein